MLDAHFPARRGYRLVHRVRGWFRAVLGMLQALLIADYGPRLLIDKIAA